MFDDAHRTLTLVITNEHCNGVECVEEKMRIQLRLKGCETCARELFRESRHLNFAFARIDKVTSGVLNSHDAEIHGYAKWQRREDPAQPFNSNLSKVSSQNQA